MTIQQCKYVLEIARYGSFNEAAKQLFVAQSSLSVSVRSLEQELGIQIFKRSSNGVYLTEAGAEFAQYAKQIVEQSDFVLQRYSTDAVGTHLYVATQHYDFVADVFATILAQMDEPQYRFSLQERKTHEVIELTANGHSDIGFLAIKGNDLAIMERYLNKRSLVFTPVLQAKPHVYVRKGHKLSRQTVIAAAALKDYPCLSYEQGEHSSTFFAEEIGNVNTDRQVQVSDRASLMNVLLSTDSYTIGTGIMPSTLNRGRVVSIPYQSEEYYVLGYILRGDKTPSELTVRFIDMLKQMAENKEEYEKA